MQRRPPPTTGDPPPSGPPKLRGVALRGALSWLIGALILTNEEFGHGSGNTVLIIVAFGAIALPFADFADFLRRWR